MMLIGNFFDDPFLNRIEISVKGDTSVLLGVKGLKLKFWSNVENTLPWDPKGYASDNLFHNAFYWEIIL